MNKKTSHWQIIPDVFVKWMENNITILKPALNPEPTIKVLLFMALFEANKACTYSDIREIFHQKGIIKGTIPDNTLRTSMFSLSKSLDKYEHSLQLKSERGRFHLVPRTFIDNVLTHQNDPILLLDSLAIRPEDIAVELVEKTRLPFHALYFLEWSARWWEIFSHNESEIRVQYEANSWEKLNIKERLFVNSNTIISFVSLAPGEGLAEIELLKKILKENSHKTIHYMAVDSSSRLLRAHIHLLKETLANDINQNRIICVGIIADIFNHLPKALKRVRTELIKKGIINKESDFIPESSSVLITYLGNCLGNYYQDQEIEIFSIIYNTFPNRPLEFLVGVSVMRDTPDIYKRNWDDFLLQTPKHLLEVHKLIESSYTPTNNTLPEFSLPPNSNDNERCPAVVPESYLVRHAIQGQIYRFYYKLAYELKLSSLLDQKTQSLPKGSLILLYNIVKYNMPSLVSGIETCGLFKIKYDHTYHQMVDTPNGKREYAIFSAYLNEYF